MARKKANRYGDYCEERGGVLYARVALPNGDGTYRLKRKKVPNGNRTLARQWAEQELAKAGKQSTHGGSTFETINDLANWYKRHYLSDATHVKDWESQSRKLDRIVAAFDNKLLSSFTTHDLTIYAKRRTTTDKVTQATINRDFALLRSAFRRGHDADKSIQVPKFPIDLKKEIERDRVLTADEEAAMLSHCVDVESLEYDKKNGTHVNTDKHQARRGHLRALIILAVDTALRRGEILSLSWEDIDMTGGVINVKASNTKTQKARKVGMTSRVYDELLKLNPQPSGRVFHQNTVKRSFSTVCTRAGVKDLRFHDLRHTATTRLIRAGVPHAEVMKITGHTQIKTFLRYLNLLDDTVTNAASQLDRFNGATSPVVRLYDS